MGKKINQIDIKSNKIIKTFNTVKDAFNSFGKSYGSGIIRCCQGKQKTAYGFIWKYVE